MFLESLQIKDFRSCANTEVLLKEDLTVLAGENNSGKSNILDAIRLVTSPATGRRDRYAEERDVSRLNGNPDSFTIEARFSNLTDVQRGLLITALDGPTSTRAVYGMEYRRPAERAIRGNVKFWAGPWTAQEGAEPEPDARDLIRHVYLPPLRDAQRELASGNPGRIAFLLKCLKQNDLQEQNLLDTAKKARATIASDPLVTSAASAVTAHLEKLTDGLLPHSATLDCAEPDLYGVARDLRFFLQQRGLAPTELLESGLGYANLLYVATVLAELQHAKDAELTLFLVEEPEAHLHPQLLALALDVLRNAAHASAVQVRSPDQPEGRIQVIVSTHSPHLTSAVSVGNVAITRRPPTVAGGAAEAQNRDVRQLATSTKVLPIWDLGLPDKDIKKLDRYLNVTRSALMFSPRVMLVEGLAEALLIPVVAKYFVLKGNLPAQRRFAAATLVAIDGVDFGPYLRLMLTERGGVRLADRVVVVTDGDLHRNAADRASGLEDLRSELAASSRLRVCRGRFTLEADLYLEGNETLFEKTFLELHERSQEKWNQCFAAVTSENDKASALMSLLEGTRTRKGDLAQILASSIITATKFTVPAYLADAIQAVVEVAETP